MRALVLADRPAPGAPISDAPTSGATPTAALLRPLGGVPLLARQMRILAREGVRRIGIAATGPEAGPLRDLAAAEAARLGLVLEDGRSSPDAPTLVIDGPVLFDIDLARLAEVHASRTAALTVVAQPTLQPRDSDLLAERDGRIVAVVPKHRPSPQDQRNLSPAGIWLAAPGVLPNPGPDFRPDVVRDLLPALLAAGRPVACRPTTEYLARLDDEAAVAAAEADLAAGRPEALRLGHRRPALLLDVDGVLNHDPGPQGALAPDDIVMVAGAG
ncbi:hypothetical protein CH341_16505, partial [Rhodoplanes roseus]